MDFNGAPTSVVGGTSLSPADVQLNSLPGASVSVQDLQLEGSGLVGESSMVVVPSTHDAGAAVEVSGSSDLTHVLTGLQQSGELGSVLQQQPQLMQGLSAIAAGDVSTDPESLRFQFSTEEATGQPTPAKKQQPSVYREQDRFLPIANVARIMRNAIPKNGKVSKDAKECMQECVSEFISFITSEACDKCSQEKRKTITGDDILYAMATLGFDNYLEPLRLYLQTYREFARSEKMATLPQVSVLPQSISASHSRSSVGLSKTPSSESLQQTGSGFSNSTTAPQLAPMVPFSSYEQL